MHEVVEETLADKNARARRGVRESDGRKSMDGKERGANPPFSVFIYSNYYFQFKFVIMLWIDQDGND